MALSAVQELPTNYQYFTSGGIQNGLSANQSYFTLNEKNITIYSGAMHYFRVPKQYWRDRLRKMRAAGLNTVETYVPWNLHEFENGNYDFGDGGSDMQDFLDVKSFLKTAQEEDLFAIVRPGPYICSEWEFGGLPSWLLRYKNIGFRTSEPVYLAFVKRYFNMLLPILTALQFMNGGPIIAFQVENEYGAVRNKTFNPDKEYLKAIRNIMLDNGIKELLVTSDGVSGSRDYGTLTEYFLHTANFARNAEKEFNVLKEIQKNKPTMAMEFWTGWFDHWAEHHHTRDNKEFREVFETILKYPASVNMYMFEGGTNFGFLNGANQATSKTDNSDLQPDINSYDYDAPLSEAGDYTEKYDITKELIEKYSTVKTKLPEKPKLIPRVAYDSLDVEQAISMSNLIENNVIKVISHVLLPMELLPINNNSGQSYGYIVYRQENVDLPAKSVLKIMGHVCDTVMVLVNGKLVSPVIKIMKDLDGFGAWRAENSSLVLNEEKIEGATIDLVVENFGRNNYGGLMQFYQFKGLWKGDVTINDKTFNNWIHVPFDFKKSWNRKVKEQSNLWMPSTTVTTGPMLYRATLTITDDPQDTYIDMSNWTKGIVVVNDFVLSRYASFGPQQSIYLPAPLLHQGENIILVFEHYVPSDKIVFSTDPNFFIK